VDFATAAPVYWGTKMTYFADLSDYEYMPEFSRAGTLNVGWLDPGHQIHQGRVNDDAAATLWQCCKVSVAQTRGIHLCELCNSGIPSIAERDGVKLLLGSAEIRVLTKGGRIYAAPTLIYHYIEVHQYLPPDEFLQALADGVSPPAPEYFEKLKGLNLAWSDTSTHQGELVLRRLL
jgi:hypothetical protein